VISRQKLRNWGFGSVDYYPPSDEQARRQWHLERDNRLWGGYSNPGDFTARRSVNIGMVCFALLWLIGTGLALWLTTR
jgi:hypothetical protein